MTTIRRWIRNGKLTALPQGRLTAVVYDEVFMRCAREVFDKKYQKPTEQYFPDELLAYKDFHQAIDYLAWLIKVTYSSPRDVKKRHFNLQRLFEGYLTKHRVELSGLRRHFLSAEPRSKLVTDDLKRGWYNELAFIYPLKDSTLGVSFRDISTNINASTERFSFPSWKIVEFYYSTYFYFRSIALLKNPNFRIQEHRATLNAFKNSALDGLKKTIWKFPFDIEFRPSTKYFAKSTLAGKLAHLQHQYSTHPREPHLLPIEIAKELAQVFRARGKRFNTPAHYTLFDFFQEFRIWANYLDIDNLLSLYGSGFKGFLDQNLSLLLFFVAGFAELIYIAVHGEKKYLKELQDLYGLMAMNNSEMKINFKNSSVFQRMRIYKLNGFITGEIKLEEEVDVNAVC